MVVVKGDKVGVMSDRFPGVWEVVKVNDVTVDLVQGERRLRADKSRLVPEGEGLASAILTGSRPAGLVPGAVVTWQAQATRGKAASYPAGTPFVVLKDKGKMIEIVRLGGDPAGTRWNVSPSRLTVVDHTQVWNGQVPVSV
jgi:hypothetical protein